MSVVPLAVTTVLATCTGRPEAPAALLWFAALRGGSVVCDAEVQADASHKPKHANETRGDKSRECLLLITRSPSRYQTELYLCFPLISKYWRRVVAARAQQERHDFGIDAQHQSFTLGSCSSGIWIGSTTRRHAVAAEEEGMDTMTNGLVSDLELKHRTLNEQVDRLARRAYLTPTEQQTVAALKKEKLLTRDLLTRMRRP